MTKQEIFNKAYLGLKSQGFKRSKWAGGCRYNGPDNMHCAIGWVVPNLPETFTISAITISFPEKLIGVIVEDRNALDELRPFLRDLQTAHDRGFEPYEMISNLRNLAKTHNLEVPE